MSADSDQYERGYYKGHGFPGEARTDLARPDISESYKRGVRDALAGLPSNPFELRTAPPATTPPPARAPSGGGVYLPPPGPPSATPAPIGGPRIPVRPAPVYNPKLPPGRWQVAPGNARFYEVLATSPLGKLPYDYAVGIERQANQGLLITLLQAAINFEVLGADPSDWQRGYGLSGPNGAIAQRIGRLISQGVLRGNQADPAFYGLDGWYGAKTRSGVKIFGRGELQALGLVG